MFGLSSARKAAEIIGIMDEAEQIEAAEPVQEYVPYEETITLKEIAGFKPFVRNPQRDLEVLTELFGVWKGEQTKWEMCCPECDHEATIDPLEGIPIDEIIFCQECGHEDELGEFFDGTVKDISTSRTPTDEELYLAALHFDAVRNGYSFLGFERNRLMRYYGILSGNMERDEIDAGYDREGTPRKHCSESCQNQGCTCYSEYANYFGKLYSVQEGIDKYNEWATAKGYSLYGED